MIALRAEVAPNASVFAAHHVDHQKQHVQTKRSDLYYEEHTGECRNEQHCE